MEKTVLVVISLVMYSAFTHAQGTCASGNQGVGFCNGLNYDFTRIKNPADGTTLFSGTSGDGYTYLFNMVGTGISDGSLGCTFDPAYLTNAGGQLTSDKTTCYPIGDVNQQAWTYVAGTGGAADSITVTFSGGQDTRELSAFFTCTPGSTTIFTTKGETSPGSSLYEYDISSPDACGSVAPIPTTQAPGPSGPSVHSKPGLTGGGIMLIIFFSVMPAYFIFGFIINQNRFQKNGRDAIPQVEFWSSLPGLVTDGIKFSLAKVRGQGTGSYASI